MSAHRKTVTVCSCPGCTQRGAAAVREALERSVAEHELGGQVEVQSGDCGGLCGIGPVLQVPGEGVIYQGLKAQDAARIVKEHLAGGVPIERMRYAGPGAPESVPLEAEHPFTKDQLFWVMRNKGLIDPELIDEYIARDGYFGLANRRRPALRAPGAGADRHGRAVRAHFPPPCDPKAAWRISANEVCTSPRRTWRRKT